MAWELSVMAAWWGAGVATFLGIWDIWKWCYDRPRLALNVRCPSLAELIDSEDFLSIDVEVVNGKSAASIRLVRFRYFGSWWRRFLRKPDYIKTIARPEFPKPVAPGDISLITLDEEDGDVFCVECLSKGILLVDVFGTHRNRPVTARIRFRKDSHDLNRAFVHDQYRS